MPTTTTNGTGGTAALPFFERDSQFAINGYFVGNDSAAGTISFQVADQDGNTFNAVISSSLTTDLGNTFLNSLSLIDILNSGLATARVNVQASLTSGNQLRFLSAKSGKDVWLAVNDVTSMPTYKSLNRNFGLSSGSRNGTGDGSFRIHIANNQPQFQIGADEGQIMKIGFQDMSSEALNVNDLDLTTIKGAQESLWKLNLAIDKVSGERSKLGSFQNRLEHTVNNLRTTYSNLTASESRIRDTDMALEMVEFTRNQIISQSGTAMLAQANLIPQGVLQLLK
ncbi:flagellin [bacterium]|nr:flagellin [bacterium]